MKCYYCKKETEQEVCPKDAEDYGIDLNWRSKNNGPVQLIDNDDGAVCDRCNEYDEYWTLGDDDEVLCDPCQNHDRWVSNGTIEEEEA
jgi:hypothetical protein